MAKKVEARPLATARASGTPERTASAPEKIAHQRIDREPEIARAARRRLKRDARKLAAEAVRMGLYETRADGRGVARITNRAALAALTSAFERLFANGCAPRVELLDEAAALGFPSAANRQPWAERCWLALAIDPEGRVAFQTHWAAGDASPDEERRLVTAASEPHLLQWCATPGFGEDFDTEGSA